MIIWKKKSYYAVWNIQYTVKHKKAKFSDWKNHYIYT